MTANDPTAAGLAGQGQTGPGSPAGSSGPGPSQAVKDFAAKCEVNKWKQMMAKMRADAINRSPIGRQARGVPPTGRSFTELTPAEQQALVNQNANRFGNPPPSPPANPPGVGGPTMGANGAPPTNRDCLQHQGNVLAWQTANNGGVPPGWAGEVPRNTASSAGTSTSGGATGGGGE
jgi:hypothetical protein